MNRMEQFKDLVLNKWLSRKLFVFLVATGLLIASIISQDIWLYISMLFVGANVAEGLVNVLSAKKGIGTVVAEVAKEITEEPKKEEEKDATNS